VTVDDHAPPGLVGDLVVGVRAGNRAALGRAITLVESTLPEDRDAADALLVALHPHTGGSLRVGISGAPGVGKSTLIEALGKHLTAAGHRVAVLAVDPSSVRSGGSILGDKTRMTELARDPNAFIRPSPAGTTLGGVARRTRETIAVCEAAGFEVVIVETVGVGQSEVMVEGMVDAFVVLVLPGGGDELQGIKRGILELADLVVVTKADGADAKRARRVVQQYASALRLLPPRGPGWVPRTAVCSAIEGTGIDAIWEALLEHRVALQEAGWFEERRREQNISWMWQAVDEGLRLSLRSDPRVTALLARVEPAVRQGSLAPDNAAAQLLAAFRGN
jgi:LAO/AO transport system kinase